MNMPEVLPDDFVHFSARYGLVEGIDLWGQPHWKGRHGHHGVIESPHCPPPAERACECPGSGGRRRCCELLTQEDFLCDACREHCWGVTPTGLRRRFVEVYENVVERPGQPGENTDDCAGLAGRNFLGSSVSPLHPSQNAHSGET